MTIGLVGQKIGMTRVFEQDGRSVPVSVVEVKPNVITQVKSLDTDGYNAIQVTTGSKPASRVNKPLTGHYAKAKVEPGLGLWEFRYDASEVANKKSDEEGEGSKGFAVGDQITVELFEQGQVVDVTGTSKGKGFAGAVKRHNFATQDATHGNSLSHRAPGSIGQNQTPGRVFKGKKMAGQLGNKRSTTQNLQVVRIDAERSLLLIKGAIPGAPGTNVIVKPAVKSTAGGAGHAA